MTLNQSAFVNSNPNTDYSKLDYGYKSPELINYNKPLSVADSNRAGLFKDVSSITPYESLNPANTPLPSSGDKPWYQDGNKMQGYAGLASSFAQLASLPGQLKLAKLQREGLKENIAQAKTDNAFRANVRQNLSNYRTGG